MSKPFVWQKFLVQSKDNAKYKLLSNQHATVAELDGEEVIRVTLGASILLAQQAFYRTPFFLRAGHLKQIASILHGPQASSNDKYVVLQLLCNAEISARGVLSNRQDTGTAAIVTSEEQHVQTGGDDVEVLSRDVYPTFTESNPCYSQNVPLDIYIEVNTQTNLPAQIGISTTPGNEYRFLLVDRDGGSVNRATLYQETKSVLQLEKLTAFLIEKMRSLGTAAYPSYRIAFVVGSLSADQALKVAELASAKYYGNLPTSGNELDRASHDTALEARLPNASRESGIGAQFSGKYFAYDIRVIRLPRYGDSCLITMALSCSADRNIKAKINKHGIWLEKLERNLGKFIPDSHRVENSTQTVQLGLNRPLCDILYDFSALPIGTHPSLSGSIVIVRNIAHANIKARLDSGEPMPEYMKEHTVYYVGPTKTPENQACGLMGPTTSGHIDGYVDTFQA